MFSMKVYVLISALAVTCATSRCSAFSFPSLIHKANPSIKKYAEAQNNALLKIHLDIGEKGGRGYRLGINGMLLELRGKESADYKHPNLPGAQGPNPQLSTGAKALCVLRKGKYVDLTGSHRVTMDNGAWEMIWRKGKSAGALVCGFDVPNEVKRNDASLPAGRVYVTFPVWTSESLEILRNHKKKAEEKAMVALEWAKDEVRLMKETNNPLMKALHNRNAFKASEDYDYSGHRVYAAMPLDRDMIELEKGLRLCTSGTVWTKTDGFFGGDHVLLGSARAMSGVREGVEQRTVFTKRELKSVALDGLRP